MRIVHLITRLIVGGAQENTLLSCAGQHNNGHDVTLITGPSTGPEGSLMQAAQSAGFRIQVVDEMRRSILPLKDWQTHRQLVKLLESIRPDIVHTHSSKAGIIGRHAARRARVPVVVHTIHGLAFTAGTHPLINHFYTLLERRAAPLTDKIVCVADAMREQSLAAGVGLAEQYTTIYSGMETGPFVNPVRSAEEIRRELGLADEHVVVGTIARLFHLKGHEDLVAIAPELCEQNSNLRFLWVGDGILRSSLEKDLERIGLRDRFILTGLVSPQKVPELTAAMDLLVHPSRREGLARALPQAQLAGKPVIAYDIDGNREGLIDNQTGFILPSFDKSAVAEKIALLAGNAVLRQEMGQKGREFALARFDANVMVAALEKLYAELLVQKTANNPQVK